MSTSASSPEPPGSHNTSSGSSSGDHSLPDVASSSSATSTSSSSANNNERQMPAISSGQAIQIQRRLATSSASAFSRSRPGGPQRVQHPVPMPSALVEAIVSGDQLQRQLGLEVTGGEDGCGQQQQQQEHTLETGAVVVQDAAQNLSVVDNDCVANLGDDTAFDVNANSTGLDDNDNDDDEELTTNVASTSSHSIHQTSQQSGGDSLDCDQPEVDETERLLDVEQSPETGNEGAPAAFGRRTSRVRTLSGTPLSVPLNCSPAVLRHGQGTALSTNTGDVVGAGSGGAGVEATATAKFEEIGKRKNIKWDAALLIEGVLFRANYLGSTQLPCDGQPTKNSRMMQAEEAVSRIKAPDGEHQPSTEVDLCISTQTIMVLNTGSQDIIMDPPLRTISYIADIGDLVVLMARRPLSRPPQQSADCGDQSGAAADSLPAAGPPPKILCHVFESREALLIAQTIGQAFQVAYSEFLRANGLSSADDDAHGDPDRDATLDLDYQAVLSSQQIAGDELEVFTHRERQKEITIAKAGGEICGLVLVESGWGSLLPTVVVANMLATGAAARGGEMCIGDQIIAVEGVSLVGLPLARAESVIGRVARGRTAVQFTLVPCAPVVEVLIRRPSTKYQLGFSVQAGVVCSLLRGGIAERGGVRVGHRIIEINEQSVVAVTHERIVQALATAVGEIRMKTMPTSMFRLLTGQDNPVYI